MMRWMCVRSIVIERVDNSFEEYESICQEIAAIEKRLSCEVSQEIYKLTFLQLEIVDDETIEAKSGKIRCAATSDFLGYAIVINLTFHQRFKRSYIFQAVIRELSPWDCALGNAALPSKLPSLYLHVKTQFNCFVLGKSRNYQIVGTFFRQQNAITNVCAHACALMMLNNCKETTGLITCEDINRIIGMDHENRALVIKEEYGSNDRATEEGISTWELCKKVFPHFGFKPDNYDQKDFGEFLYGFIESGYPALLTFSTPRGAHVVAVVGHTWSPHSWFPNAFPSYNGKQRSKRYLSSLAWINDFVVHDDNFGMQLSLPTHCLNIGAQAETGKDFAPLEGIGIFPQKKGVQLLGPAAEKEALRMLHQVFRMFYSDGKPPPTENYYVSHLQEPIFSNVPTVVLRTTLVERSAYLEHLKCPDNMGLCYVRDSLDEIFKQLSDHERVWLVEITEPDLYVGNLSKVIDVLIDPKFDPGTRESPRDLRNALIMLRFPGFLLRPKEIRPNDVEYYPPIQIGDVVGHLSLYRA